jgi:hypothetical protein
MEWRGLAVLSLTGRDHGTYAGGPATGPAQC